MIFRIIMGVIIFWMTTASLLPFFGINFVLFRGAVFEPILIDASNTYLHIIRSSTFASMAFFGVNYLRRKRPLSSVAPLLVFVCFFGNLRSCLSIHQRKFSVVGVGYFRFYDYPCSNFLP